VTAIPFERRQITIEDLDRVVLTRDIPEKKLKAGDVGTGIAPAFVEICLAGFAS